LHQGASVSLTSAPKMASTMLTAMLIMTFACWAYTIAVALYRVRSLIIETEAHNGWLQQSLNPNSGKSDA
jgi:heme exporter protein C